ncbi:DsbA family protein [Streptomyces somaliensis DSM 40738]|uniref:Thioredoxin domain-containing protein n=1 Tax=Streptomyces somaliensis (strain ATCC 33201 / DSM 40738 / JCM 12659 / KCTC 9044 / NCTC 11332 / NRRL B-12077 / IP 733) TaxID=1134445 RepID=A0AA44DGS0_STRE0|nr:thioredoxin domain-containing protein [Streptomyces somaliensis]MCQ0022319.1 DsbA family protein [Streptomyces somaliensis DSM 40738]NKY16309.1 thioredoxin domain-containing protein [Streptomyces somaliensis DSM 40738]
MNEKNRAGKQSARQRLQIERERERAREKRRRLVLVTAAVAGVLALAAVVGVIAANTGGKGDTSGKGPVAAPSGAVGEDRLVIPVGAPDAPATLTVWEDFRCPACAVFENTFRDTIHELEAAGQLRTEYRLATLIDGNMGGGGSLNAANAAACAQDAGKFSAYHDVLFANQPEEADDAFARDAKLFELAGKVPGLDSPAFRSCVAGGTHDGWVRASNEAFRAGDFRGTPTVLLNGEPVFPAKGDEQISPANLRKWVAQANEGKEPGTATPSAGASAPAGGPRPGSSPAGGTGGDPDTGSGPGSGAGSAH